MNRRNYLSMLTTGIVPFLNNEWREKIWNTTDPPATTEAPTLQNFLIPESALNDDYTPVDPDQLVLGHAAETTESGAHHKTTAVRMEQAQAPWDADVVVSYRSVYNEAVLPSEAVEAELSSWFAAVLQSHASKPRADTTPDMLHRYLWHHYSECLGVPGDADDRGEAVYTIQESPYPRSDLWVRSPVADQVSEHPVAASQPYSDLAVTVTTTEWGVLTLYQKVNCPATAGREIETVRVLADALHERSTQLPAPQSNQPHGSSETCDVPDEPAGE